MGSDLHHEYITNKVRTCLNEQHVKLWEPPYYEEGTGPNEVLIQVFLTPFFVFFLMF